MSEAIKKEEATKPVSKVVEKDTKAKAVKAVSTKATAKDSKTAVKSAVKKDEKATAKAPKVSAPKVTPEEMLLQAKKTTLAEIKKLQTGDVVKTYNDDLKRFQKAVFVGWDEKAQSALFELCHNIWEINKELLDRRPTLILTGKKDVPEWNSQKVQLCLSKYPFLMKISLFQKTFGKEIAQAMKPAKTAPVKA